MTIPTAHKVLGSALFVMIATTLTKIPGLENLKIMMGEKEGMSRKDLDQTHENEVPSGTFTQQTATFDLIWDPLNAVHQYLHISFNPDADPEDDTSVMDGKIKYGTTGVEETCKFWINKFDIDLQKGAGQKAAVEIKFSEPLLLNEEDPA
jgi:hypothetical protein